MKTKILFIIITLMVGKYSFAQNFLEVKYSINDIKKQREKFMNEKIKSVIVKDNYSEKIFEIDESGKIISENGKGENPYTITYNYDLNNNLTGFSGPFAHGTFQYDNNGNVMNATDETTSSTFHYDSNNKLLKIIVEMESEEGEGSCGPEKIMYSDEFIVEEISPCCMGFIERTVYEYSDIGNLTSIINYESHCSDKIEKIRDVIKYFYNSNSNLPFKMNEETIFTYEYYD